MKAKRIFTGTAGVYYVLYQLAARGYHASGTHGNAPNIDVLVSSENGDRAVSVQVKTTEHATRWRGRGANRKAARLDFPLDHHSAKLNHPNVMFAFVDLDRWSAEPRVTVYWVPSKDVLDFCAPWVDRVPMVRFQPTIEWVAPYREDWKWLEAAVGPPPDKEVLLPEATEEVDVADPTTNG